MTVTNIRKVRLHNIRLVNSAHQTDVFGTRWASKLISQISSPHVEEIIFSFSEYRRPGDDWQPLIHWHNMIRTFDWQSVGNALESLKQLRRFNIELCQSNFLGARDDLLQKYFKNDGLHDLAARGILKLTYR